MGAKARELAHLLRRLRRRAGRRHVGFRRPRGRGSGELHSIWARSDKWSWRRQKGEKDLPNLCHTFVQQRPCTIPGIAQWSCFLNGSDPSDVMYGLFLLIYFSLNKILSLFFGSSMDLKIQKWYMLHIFPPFLLFN